MAVTEQPKTYKTSDGREFKDEAKALDHEALVSAKSAYDDAREAWRDFLFGRFRTADGKPLKMSVLTDFYYVQPSYYKLSRIERINFWGGEDTRVEPCEHRDGIRLMHRPRRRESERKDELLKWREIRLEDLYADEREAELEVARRNREAVLRLDAEWPGSERLITAALEDLDRARDSDRMPQDWSDDTMERAGEVLRAYRRIKEAS